MRFKSCAFGSAAAFALLVWLGFNAKAQADSRDGLPPLNTAKLQFGTGKVVNNKAEISPDSPSLPGHSSPWVVQQWQQTSIISAANMERSPAGTASDGTGSANIKFSSQNGHSHVWVYERQNEQPVFDLYERDGWVTDGGGSNLFLAADTLKPTPNFSDTILFSIDAAVSQASISYDTPQAKATGAVLGMAFNGFVIQFPSPVSGARSTLFLQFEMTNSREKHTPFTTCAMSSNGALTMLSGGDLSEMKFLPFEKTGSGLTHLSYNLSSQISKLFAKPLGCRSSSGAYHNLSLTSIALGNIDVEGVYIGLETEAVDRRSHSVIAGRQGAVQLGLEISNPVLKVIH